VVDPWGGAGQRRSGAHQGAAPNGVGASMGHKETSGAFGALAARAALLKDGEDPRQVGIFDRPARSPERAVPAPAIPLPTDVQRVVGGLLATYDAGGNVYTFAAVGDMLAIYAPSVRIYWTDRGTISPRRRSAWNGAGSASWMRWPMTCGAVGASMSCAPWCA